MLLVCCRGSNFLVKWELNFATKHYSMCLFYRKWRFRSCQCVVLWPGKHSHFSSFTVCVYGKHFYKFLQCQVKCGGHRRDSVLLWAANSLMTAPCSPLPRDELSTSRGEIVISWGAHELSAMLAVVMADFDTLELLFDLKHQIFKRSMEERDDLFQSFFHSYCKLYLCCVMGL